MYDHINMILFRVRLCKERGQRVVFIGFDEGVFRNLVQARLLEGLDFELATSVPKYVGQKAQFGANYPVKSIFSLAAVPSLKPALVVILPQHDVNIGQCYETVMAAKTLSATDVLLPPSVWSDRFTGGSDITGQLAEQIPADVEGGLSSTELVTHLGESMAYIARCKVPGDIVNMGVYRGWSLYLLALLMKHHGITNRILWGFDTFEGFLDVDNVEDSFVNGMKTAKGADWNVHTSTSFSAVQKLFQPFPFVKLVKGDIAKTMYELKDRQIALALSDMDDYTPTAASLDYVYERMVPGGILAHDHFAYPSLNCGTCFGQRQAMLEMLERHPMLNFRGTNVFVKPMERE